MTRNTFPISKSFEVNMDLSFLFLPAFQWRVRSVEASLAASFQHDYLFRFSMMLVVVRQRGYRV